MTQSNDPSETQTVSLQRRLISWPLTLLAITLALLFIANSVSAWGKRDHQDLDEIKGHVEHVLERMLDRVDATQEQSVEIESIVFATVDELHAQHTAWKAENDEPELLRDWVTAPTIDRDAFEALRVAHLERADEMTRKVADTLADVLDVLSPEQRIELEAQLSKHKHRRGRGFFGGHGH